MATTAKIPKYANLPSSIAGYFHNLTASPGVPGPKSQAYIAIFEDVLDQLAVLGDISAEVKKGVDSKSIGDDIAKMLKDQKTLESRYNDLIKEQDKLKGLQNKTQYKESQIAMFDINAELQQSNQSLARTLRSHPSVAANLLKIQNERNVLQALISKTGRELRDCHFESLVVAVEEEYKKKNTLQNTINRENEASELLKELQEELATEKRLLEEELNERNQAIQQLKDTIQEIHGLTTSEQNYIKKETKAHENSVRLRNSTKEATLREDKEHLAKHIDQEKKAHDMIVEFLTKQREQMEHQIQDWMTKYEDDTESKTTDLEQLKQRRTTDLDRFEELVAKYEELERTVEEDKQIKAKEAEEKRVLLMRENAAFTIQRFWNKVTDRKKREKSAKKGVKTKGGKAKAGSAGKSKAGSAGKTKVGSAGSKKSSKSPK